MTVLSEWAVKVRKRFPETGGSESAQNGPETTQPDRPRTSLFACSECNTVYIAITKTRCTSCDTAVEQVPSTLTEPV